MEKNNKNDIEKIEFNPNTFKETHSKNKWWGLFFAFLFAMALSNVVSPYFSQIINGLLTGLTPLLFGIALAFIFYRFVDFIERVVLKNAFANSPYKFTIKRSISIVMVVVVILGICAIILAILVPRIIDVIQKITAGNGDGGTQIYNNVVNEIALMIERWFGTEITQEVVRNNLNSVFDWFLSVISSFSSNIFKLLQDVLTGFFNIAMGLVVAILFLKDKEKISRFSRRFCYAHFKKEKADEMCVLVNNSNKILFNYVICKLIEFSIILFSLGLTYVIMGLEFTWELALVVGIFNFIPYFGIYIGIGFALLLVLIFDSVNSALYMLLASFIITTIEFNIILPIITGSRLKISSLGVICSIIVGGAMFGIPGMFIAPPVFAILSVVITGNVELKENHMKYVMELNKAREKAMQDEKEQLGLAPQVNLGENSNSIKAEVKTDDDKSQNAKEETTTAKRNKSTKNQQTENSIIKTEPTESNSAENKKAEEISPTEETTKKRKKAENSANEKVDNLDAEKKSTKKTKDLKDNLAESILTENVEKNENKKPKRSIKTYEEFLNIKPAEKQNDKNITSNIEKEEKAKATRKTAQQTTFLPKEETEPKPKTLSKVNSTKSKQNVTDPKQQAPKLRTKK